MCFQLHVVRGDCRNSVEAEDWNPCHFFCPEHVNRLVTWAFLCLNEKASYGFPKYVLYSCYVIHQLYIFYVKCNMVRQSHMPSLKTFL